MAFTKILGPGIHTLANFHSHNINSSGIITATKFVGDMTVGGGSTGTFSSLTITGNLGVGGTITYTDVTNIDAVGIITAQSGVYIGAGATVGSFNTTTGISSFKTLNVDETSTLNGSVGIADSIIHIGNTDTSIRFPSDDTVSVETAGTERFKVESNGYVSVPWDSSSQYTLLRVGDISGTSEPQIQLYTDTSANTAVVNSRNNHDLTFRTNNTEKLRIDSDGLVGVATDNPKKTLNVFAGVGTTELIRLSQSVDSSVQQNFGIGWCSNNNHTWPGALITSQEYDVSDPRRHLLFYTRGLNSDTAPIERLRITYEGNVDLYGATAGVTSCTWDASANTLIFKDNVKAAFGNGSDLQIYHSGSHSYIKDSGTGALAVNSDNFYVNNAADNETLIHVQEDVGVKLYDGANTKRFETTSAGITVTGEVAASQEYPNFRPRVDWNFAAVKKLDPRIKYRRQNNASYTDEFGMIRQVSENEPRFDHDPITGECKGLLLEEGRTNLVASSEDMNESFGSWVNNGIGARYTDSSGVISPDGTTGSTKLIENGATSSHLIYDNVSCSASTGYITSVFLKKPATNGRTFALITEGNTQNATAYFNLVDGTTTNNSGTGFVSSGTIEYPNGWWRCWMRFNTGGSQSSLNVQFGPAGDSGTGTFSYAGDSNKYILAWGAQCESGEMVTSYIKTERHANDNGSTRGQDFTTVEGTDFSDIFDTDFKQFSMVADYDNTTTPDGNSYSIIDLWGEETNYEDRIEWFKLDSSPYHIETRAFGGNSAIFVNGELSASTKAKAQRFATSWYVPDYSNTSSRRFVVSMGGEAVDVVGDNSGTSVPSLTRLGIGCNPTRLDFSGGVLHFKRLMFYNRTLSDGQLQNLSAQ